MRREPIPADLPRVANTSNSGPLIAPPRVVSSSVDTPAGKQCDRATLPIRFCDPAELAPRKRKGESTAWLGSLVLHSGIALLLWVLLAPADLGGLQTLTIRLSATDPDPISGPLEMLPSPQDDTQPPAAELAEVDLVNLLAVESPGKGRAEGKQTRSVGQRGEGTRASAGGTFFGLEADGHEFVYIVDMSGSMRGRRYQRATNELLRSVGALRPTQHFYVVLFSSTTVALFNQPRTRAESVPASEENKAKLAAWVKNAFSGGGTDPRSALRLALSMDPDAIFMLSDGAFNGHKKQKKAKLFGNNTDAFSIVAAASGDVPIHAIAFENVSSKDNMSRLAEMTGGQFRFEPPIDQLSPQTVLELAEGALRAGEPLQAATYLSDVLRISDEVNKRGSGEGSQPTDGLPPTLSGEQAAIERAERLVADMAQRRIAEARAAMAANDLSAAVGVLDHFISLFAASDLSQPVKLERESIRKAVLSRFNELRSIEGEVAAARYVSRLSSSVAGTSLQKHVDSLLDSMLVSMIKASHAARLRGDHNEYKQIQTEMEQAFRGTSRFDDYLRNRTAREVRARGLLRIADRSWNRGAESMARQQYQRIVEEYRFTVTAARARKRLTDRAASELEDMNTVEAMQLIGSPNP